MITGEPPYGNQSLMNRMILATALTIALLAGCANSELIGYDNKKKYLTFNHPFTDEALADAQSRAEKLCAQRNQVALQTSKKCSLTQCATNFQCLEKADAVPYGL